MGYISDIEDGIVPVPLREEIVRRLSEETERSRRLFHGRGNTFEGLEWLTVDWYAPVAVVIIYSECPESFLAGLADLLEETLGGELDAVVVQRRYLTDTPFAVLRGELPDRIYSVEDGLRYRLRLSRGRNLGFFLDMARGRDLCAGLAPGKRVLNLFAYTCAFSVVALKSGAAEVVNLDMNRRVLGVGRENHEINGLDPRRASFLAHDLFKSFGKLKRLGPFGLVILDPPTHQEGSFESERDWVKLARRLPEFTEPGADVIACLNAVQLGPEFITEIFSRELPEAKLVGTLGPPSDFPEKYPERGLKILHYRLG